MNSLTRLVPATLLVLCTLISLSAQTEPKTHSQYRAQKVTGVATFNNSGEIGNAIFTSQPTKFDQPEYPGVLTSLEFAVGDVPNIYCRRFFPATLKQAVDYIKSKEPTASDFKMQTNFKLVKGPDLLGTGIAETPIRSEMLADPTYNTAHADLANTDLPPRLRALGPGQYSIGVETYITYQYVTDKLTGAKGPSNILLAAGKLPVVVR